MKLLHRLANVVAIVVVGVAVAIACSVIARADQDTDLAAQLHTDGIYGPGDYNAWLGKIVCQRMDTNVDHDAYQSVTFLAGNLDRHNTTEQNWQFLGAAIDFYCPQKRSVLEQAAIHR